MEELLRLCGCAGCVDAMVVRSQRSGVLLNNTVLGLDVLLFAQGC